MDTLANASTLIAAEKVQGAKVYSATGDSLGSIDDIVINEKSGNVAYAIISFGGFLGIGTRYHSLPWSMLRHDLNLHGYVVNVDRTQLREAPAYGRWL